jgi:hypothetical protein
LLVRQGETAARVVGLAVMAVMVVCGVCERG